MTTAQPFSPFGNDLFGEPIRAQTSSPVAQKFLVPPFSVLSARDGDWQDRKRAWAAMGIKGEVGRSAKSYNINSWLDKVGEEQKAAGDGTSIFDPVLCEIIYRWFSPECGQIIDPFAGGSVRGVVAARLGRKYWGERTARRTSNRESRSGCATLPRQSAAIRLRR